MNNDKDVEIRLKRYYRQAYAEIEVPCPSDVDLEDVALITAFKSLKHSGVMAFKREDKKTGIVVFSQFIFILPGDTQIKIGCPTNKTIYIHVSTRSPEPPEEMLDKIIDAFKELLPIHIENYRKVFLAKGD